MGLLHKSKGKHKAEKEHEVSPQRLHLDAIMAVPPTPFHAVTYQSSPLDLAIAQVISALETYGLHYTPDRARALLSGRFAHGDPKQALALALALRDAEDMIVVPPTAHYLHGSENLNGTTCYLDALLFAMYSRAYPIFDALLYHSSKDVHVNRLIVNLRLFVNLLRSGYLITSDLIDMLRKSIAACGWADAASQAQQDSSECFGFIAEMLMMPTLTFKVHIAHGGQTDAGADNKIVEERFLALSVPQPTQAHATGPPIELVDLIDSYFHTKLMVRRSLARSKSTISTQSSYSGSSRLNANGYAVEKKMTPQNEVAMEAWQLFELVPHYTATDSSAREQDFAQQPPVVAICLKRYYFDRNGTAQINKTPIVIPEFIDFTSFTASTNHRRRTRLVLESAVCHRGRHVGSGHYVSVVRGEAPGQWLLFDDLARHRVTQSSFTELFTTEVPYLLFYQLELSGPMRPPHPNRRQPSVPNFAAAQPMNIPQYTPLNQHNPFASHAPLPPYPIDKDSAATSHSGYLAIPPAIPEHSRPQ